MAATPNSRSGGTIHLLVGGVLLLVELYLLFGRYTEWQAGNFNTFGFVINIALLILAGYFLRAGWEMRRGKDNLLD